jgi:hypothetical protein
MKLVLLWTLVVFLESAHNLVSPPQVPGVQTIRDLKPIDFGQAPSPSLSPLFDGQTLKCRELLVPDFSSH